MTLVLSNSIQDAVSCELPRSSFRAKAHGHVQICTRTTFPGNLEDDPGNAHEVLDLSSSGAALFRYVVSPWKASAWE